MSGEERTPVELSGSKLGQYLLSSMIARGGTAEVYKAYHPDLDRHVVIKVLAQEYSQDPDWVRRFRREAQVLGRLDHPRVLPIHDAGEHEGRPYLVTKYVESSVTLREVLSAGPLPRERAFRTLAQIAEALQAAHASGVVHRDVKPSNVLVTPEGDCMVFDFGLAKPMHRREADTAEGKIVGTPEYMSPEQCKGDKLDPRSDIYSLGVMAYELFTGRVPFTAATPVGVMMKHLTETLPPLGVDSRLTPALHSVIARAMARSPEARFPTARDFAEALAVAAGQAPTATLAVPAPPRSKPLRDRIPLPSGRGLSGAAAAVGALFAAGVSLFWFLLAGSPQAPPPIAAPHNDGALEASAAGPLPPVAVPADSQSLSPSAPLSSVPAKEARPSGGAFTRLPPGSLVVESNLPAVVTLNGEVLGAAPGTFHSISPGRHTLGLDAGEGRTFQKQLWITAGSTARIHHDFPDKVLPPERAETAPPVEASAAHAPLAPSTDLPEKTLSPRPESPVLWEGYLTDSNCRVRGAVDNHWRCLERCLREGARPMFYSKGRLYSLRGLERIAGDRNRTVAFEGWLDPKTNIISVVEPPN